MKTLLCVAMVAVVSIVIVPIEGQTNSPKTGSNQPQAAAPKKPEAQPSPPAINVINEQATAQQGNGAKAESKGYFKRLIAPENLPTLILCVIGIAGIFVAVCTLRDIQRQTKATE